MLPQVCPFQVNLDDSQNDVLATNKSDFILWLNPDFHFLLPESIPIELHNQRLIILYLNIMDNNFFNLKFASNHNVWKMPPKTHI